MLAALQAFIAFGFASGAVYTFNDIFDVDVDKRHPRKKHRPIASGKVSIMTASCFVIFLLAGSLSIAYAIRTEKHNQLVATIIAYLVVNLFYSIKGKHVVIGDAFCIAIGFVLRVICGAYAIGVHPSGWIVITTFFLSLFLGFGKRRNEILALEADSAHHRPVLEKYNLSFLDNVIMSTGAISIISYALYTLDHEVIEKFGTEKLIYTAPFVAYGIFRYTHLLMRNKEGDPTEVIVQDRTLLIVAIAWFLSAYAIIYYAKM
jgi:4-hydroxybenzoate polyprenyltransferase